MKLSTLSSLAVAAIAVSQLGATDCGQITKDPGFDLWCGDRLCFWKTEKGDVAKVPTWIEGDDGVELVGDDVAISQITPVTSSDLAPSGCMEFDMTADIAADAEVDLELDLFGDGTIDYTQRIPTSDWEKQTVAIGITGSFEGAKFRLTKHGSGKAIVADMLAQTADSCPPPITVPPRPLGASCMVAADCAGNLCYRDTCSECASDQDCTNGDICGRSDTTPGYLKPWHECIAPASRALGEVCFFGPECASGDCTGELCEECNGIDTCGNGIACAPESDDVPINMCDLGARASGDACVTDADCASGTCTGTQLGYCIGWDLRSCNRDSDCPQLAGLDPVTCTFVAVAGGTCQ